MKSSRVSRFGFRVVRAPRPRQPQTRNAKLETVFAHLRLWPYFVEPLRARKGAALVSTLAIALGVALGVAVTAVNRAALEEFAHGMRTIAGRADLEIRGPRAGFDEALYPRLARLAGVETASPAVEFDAKIPGRDEALRLLGIDLFRAARLQPQLVAGVLEPEGGTTRFGLLDPDVIYLSVAAAQWLNARVGEEIALQSGLQQVRLRVGGLLPGVGGGQRLGVMDIAAAQWRFDRLGVLSRIDLRFAPGADGEVLARRVGSMLPSGVFALRPREAEGRQASLSRAYRVNLDMLAMMALVTGAFLVFSAQSLAVVRRRAEFAFLRAAGVTRRMLVAWLVAEGAATGVPGAALGVPLGYALAQGALALFGPDLGAGYFSGLRPALKADWASAAFFFLLGVAAAAAGALAPALEAAAAAPAQALKAGDEARALGRVMRLGPGLGALAAGGALAYLPPVDGLPVFGYAAIALMLVGAILLMPRLARWAFALLPGGGDAPLRIAQAQLKGAPGYAAIAGAGILASVAVAAAMAIMVTSFRHSLGGWLDQVLPAQLYGRTGRTGETGYLAPAQQELVRTTPGVARVLFLRHQNLLLDPTRPPVALLARTLAIDDPGAVLPLVAGGAARRGDMPSVWVSEAMVDLYGMRLGAEIELPLAGRRQRFAVAGIWRDYARQHGAIAMDLNTYRRLTGDDLVTDFSVWLAAGHGAAEVVQVLRKRLGAGERIDIVEPGEIRQASLRLFDRTFAVTYALEAVAILIGLAGVAASFASLARARRREFGVLRHIGMTRGQIAAMLAIEGTFVSGLGVAAGLSLGGAIGIVLIRVINRQSFHWSMDLTLPAAGLAWFGIAMVVLAALVSVIAARHAMRTEAIRAVREDW